MKFSILLKSVLFLNTTLAILTQSEISAFNDFFVAAHGENWTKKDGWDNISRGSCGKMFGVVCQTGRPSEINLQFNGLKGRLSPSIARLTTLNKIDLRYNSVSGPIPPEMKNLVNLEHLDLSFNEFSGKIPQDILNAQIKYLSLVNTKIRGDIPEQFCRSNLSHLYLYSSSICPTCDYSKVPQNDFSKWAAGGPLFCAVERLLAPNSNKDAFCSTLCTDPATEHNTCSGFKCKEGFEISSGGEKPLCLPDGSWRFGSCVLIAAYCTLRPPENGFVVAAEKNRSGVALGESAWFGCDMGYSFDGQGGGASAQVERDCFVKNFSEGEFNGPMKCQKIRSYCNVGRGMRSATEETLFEVDSAVLARCENGYHFRALVYEKSVLCAPSSFAEGRFSENCARSSLKP